MTGRRAVRAWPFVLVVLALFAAVGLWSALAAQGPATVTEQTREVAQTLRCPTCAGEDVADSAAPMAEAMRLVVAEQVAEGRSPEQIREWFAERYGDEVLLDPPLRGAGWWLWAVPAALLGLGVALVARRRLRGRWVAAAAGLATVTAVVGVWAWPTPTDRAAADASHAVSPVPVLEDAVQRAPGSAELRLALAGSLEELGRHGEAAEHYAAVTRLRPLDADVRYRHAFALVRSGSGADAVGLLEETLTVEPDHPPSLLLLGTLLLRGEDERGADLLRRFLAVAPDHPATQDVRAWLTGEAPAEEDA